jgi:IS5 family transposase
MLRIHFLQQWYALSDPGVKEALYDSVAMRRFVGIDLGQEGAPDETTVCKFRHLLEKHGLAGQLFAAVSDRLKRHGMKLSQGAACGTNEAALGRRARRFSHGPDSIARVSEWGQLIRPSLNTSIIQIEWMP